MARPTSVNIEKIIYYRQRKWIDWDENNYLDIKQLVSSGIIRSAKYGVKIIGQGLDCLHLLDKPLLVEVSCATEGVIKKVRESGGRIRVVHRTTNQIDQLINPEKHPLNYMDKYPSFS